MLAGYLLLVSAAAFGLRAGYSMAKDYCEDIASFFGKPRARNDKLMSGK
jgi:hypothetical protein